MEMLSEIIRGKSIARILFNNAMLKYCFPKGVVLDVASSTAPSYLRLLEGRLKDCKYISSDLPGSGAEREIDLNKPFEISVGFADTIFMFNAVHILRDAVATLKECHRVLKKNGVIYISAPFLFNLNPEPEDYLRLTDQGLRRFLELAGFKDIKIYFYGERFSGIAYLRDPLVPRVFRLIEYPFALLLDKLICSHLSNKYPIGFFAVGRK